MQALSSVAWPTSGWLGGELRFALGNIMPHLSSLDANSKNHALLVVVIYYNWINSIFKCTLTGSKFTNIKRRHELVATPYGCASKQKRQLLSLAAFWIPCDKQWLSLSRGKLWGGFCLVSGTISWEAVLSARSQINSGFETQRRRWAVHLLSWHASWGPCEDPSP